ncbi:MAG TPA: bifunctional N-acetylglucosamine-1-phosphate uridyltransferase/glucosamine-1-phosphate acetyltransferase [Gammaproteobacteria bacterium]|nr:bifunctional N-acetylglucosamine-1-phosphate uridyltransferase/glucosamine-1-phosphate acetyltransferase [Gammaproteobacteria bacterium]
MSLNIIILAAGRGTRMKSVLPKVLHELSGKALLDHVISTVQTLSPANIYITIGYEAEQIKAYFKDKFKNIHWVIQENLLGTGDAVKQVLPHLKNPDDKALVLYGDMPLVPAQTLQNLISHTTSDQLGIVTTHVDNPHGFGRIIRDAQHKIINIIEEKDADSAQKNITEINPGIYLTSVKNLQHWIPNIKSNNSQKEFYLTDIVSMANAITSITAENPHEVLGVNDLEQLYQLECVHQAEIAKKFRLSGVTVSSNVRFEGDVEIGAGSKIGANSIIKNSKIGKNVEIKPNSIIEDSVIHDECSVGPFARLRPGTVLDKKVKIGNFTEIKKSHIGEGSKVPHLSYVGDAVLGKHVNFGAGSIICNYDGVNKHQTVIGDNVFVGSDSQLIAPVKIGNGAFIGAGSTITKDAPANKLTVARARQTTVESWKPPKK